MTDHPLPIGPLFHALQGIEYWLAIEPSVLYVMQSTILSNKQYV